MVDTNELLGRVSLFVLGTGTIIIFLLSVAFDEAGLTQSALLADGFTLLWGLCAILHFKFIQELPNTLANYIDEWRGDKA